MQVSPKLGSHQAYTHLMLPQNRPDPTQVCTRLRIKNPNDGTKTLVFYFYAFRSSSQRQRKTNLARGAFFILNLCRFGLHFSLPFHFHLLGSSLRCNFFCKRSYVWVCWDLLLLLLVQVFRIWFWLVEAFDFGRRLEASQLVFGSNIPAGRDKNPFLWAFSSMICVFGCHLRSPFPFSSSFGFSGWTSFEWASSQRCLKFMWMCKSSDCSLDLCPHSLFLAY